MDGVAFRALVKSLFDEPERLVLGRETAHQAQQRFARALERLLAAHAGTLAVVTHGTVLSLYLAPHLGVEPYALWSTLTLPCCLVLSRPGMELQARYDRRR